MPCYTEAAKTNFVCEHELVFTAAGMAQFRETAVYRERNWRSAGNRLCKYRGGNRRSAGKRLCKYCGRNWRSSGKQLFTAGGTGAFWETGYRQRNWHSSGKGLLIAGGLGVVQAKGLFPQPRQNEQYRQGPILVVRFRWRAQTRLNMARVMPPCFCACSILKWLLADPIVGSSGTARPKM